MGERKYSDDIKCGYCHQIYRNKVLFWGWKPWASIGAYDTSSPYKEWQITTCFFSQLHFIFLSIFRGDNEKPDDSLEKVTMNCPLFYGAICPNNHIRWFEKLLYLWFNLLSSQIKDIEKEHVNDNESDTQKDKTKEVKEKDKDKAASVSMSQYRACLRWNIERQIVPIHDAEMRFFKNSDAVGFRPPTQKLELHTK